MVIISEFGCASAPINLRLDDDGERHLTTADEVDVFLSDIDAERIEPALLDDRALAEKRQSLKKIQPLS